MINGDWIILGCITIVIVGAAVLGSWWPILLLAGGVMLAAVPFRPSR